MIYTDAWNREINSDDYGVFVGSTENERVDIYYNHKTNEITTITMVYPDNGEFWYSISKFKTDKGDV